MLGELVKLRAIEPADAEALWRWAGDPEVVRWMDEGYAQSLAGAVKRMGRLRQVFRRDGQWYDMYTMGLLEGELR